MLWYGMVWYGTVCDIAHMTQCVGMCVGVCMDMDDDMDMHDRVHAQTCIRVYVVCAVVKYS